MRFVYVHWERFSQWGHYRDTTVVTQKTTWDFKVISNETFYKTKTKYNYAENVFYFHVTEYLSPKPFDKS